MDKHYKVAFVPHCLGRGKALRSVGLIFNKYIIIVFSGDEGRRFQVLQGIQEEHPADTKPAYL